MSTLEAVRAFYAEEVRTAANLQSPALVSALASVPREAFLGPGPWHVATPDPRRAGGIVYTPTADADPRHVYHNVLIAIDAARQLNNGHPGTLAGCLDALSLRPGERFLHVGCGTGYYTAVAAEMVGPEGRVEAIEIDPALAERAAENLRPWRHVSVMAGDASTHEPGPCDAILVNAGFTHPLPVWLDSLADGGRMVVPVTAATPGRTASSGAMLLVVRDGDRFHAHPLGPIAIFASPTGRNDDLSLAIRRALGTGQWLRVKTVRRDSHPETETCCIHAGEVCVSETW